jgi:hypothetical protein
MSVVGWGAEKATGNPLLCKKPVPGPSGKNSNIASGISRLCGYYETVERLVAAVRSPAVDRLGGERKGINAVEPALRAKWDNDSGGTYNPRPVIASAAKQSLFSFMAGPNPGLLRRNCLLIKSQAVPANVSKIRDPHVGSSGS